MCTTKVGVIRNRHPFSQQTPPFSLSLFSFFATWKIEILKVESDRLKYPLDTSAIKLKKKDIK
jgi:hypothetical protein